jgi:hypothetical protein
MSPSTRPPRASSARPFTVIEPLNLPATSEELLRHLARYDLARRPARTTTTTPGSDEDLGVQASRLHAR